MTTNTRWVSSKQSRDISELPSVQSWMRDVSIGDIPPTEKDRTKGRAEGTTSSSETPATMGPATVLRGYTEQ